MVTPILLAFVSPEAPPLHLDVNNKLFYVSGDLNCGLDGQILLVFVIFSGIRQIVLSDEFYR